MLFVHRLPILSELSYGLRKFYILLLFLLSIRYPPCNFHVLLVLLLFRCPRLLVRQEGGKCFRHGFVTAFPLFRQSLRNFRQFGKEGVHKKDWGKFPLHRVWPVGYHKRVSAIVGSAPKHDLHREAVPKTIFSRLWTTLCLHPPELPSSFLLPLPIREFLEEK